MPTTLDGRHHAPEPFLRHAGLTVYRAYKGGHADAPSPYVYSTDPQEDPVWRFDVRKLPTWRTPPQPAVLEAGQDAQANHDAWERWRRDDVEDQAIRQAICGAIDAGQIPFPPDAAQSAAAPGPTVEVTFSVSGWVRQRVCLSDPSLTVENLLDGLQDGTLSTTIDSDGEPGVVETATGQVVAQIVSTKNELQYFYYTVSPAP